MYRFACYLTLATSFGILLGCSMCCGPFDDDYNVFGGPFQRANPQQGRVGSVLSDPLYAGYGPSADSNLAPETPQRTPNTTDLDLEDDTELDDDRNYKKELEELRREMNLDNPGELPSPTRPKPDEDADTARSSQKSRAIKRQWR